jgi:hypothetical protein
MKTTEDRLTRLECELRDLKTRMSKVDQVKFDPRRPEWDRVNHRGLGAARKKE